MLSAASTAMAKKAPANGMGLSRSRVRITVCGPMIAAATPPSITQEMARARKAASPLSAAAKRNCWANAAAQADEQEPGHQTAEQSIDHGQPGDHAAGDSRQRAGHEAEPPADRAHQHGCGNRAERDAEIEAR